MSREEEAEYIRLAIESMRETTGERPLEGIAAMGLRSIRANLRVGGTSGTPRSQFEACDILFKRGPITHLLATRRAFRPNLIDPLHQDGCRQAPPRSPFLPPSYRNTEPICCR